VSYNGSGTFLINSAGQPVVPGTTITTTAFNALTADLASGLTIAMTKDGQTVPTANIPMGGFKLTGLGAGTSATDAAQFGQLQNAPVATLITVAGADTITGTLVQTLTAYATGQQFSFVAAGTNTTAVTLNIDGLGAKAVTRTGAVALAAGALVSGQMAIVEYDGTRFQLINANAFTNLTVSGALTVGTTLAVTGVATLTAQPILSSLTASLPVFSDGSKGLVSNAMTGTGSVMMSASPTTTGTLTAAAINASGLVAMAGAATVGTTLVVSGVATFNVGPAISGTLGITNTANTMLDALTVLNASAGNAASTRISLGNNTSAGAGQIILYGGNHATLPNYMDVTNANNALLRFQTGGGAASFGGTLSVTGTSTMAAINASGVVTVTKGSQGDAIVALGIGSRGLSIGTDTASATAYMSTTNGTTALGLGVNGGFAALAISTTGAVTIPGTLGVTGNITTGASGDVRATGGAYLGSSTSVNALIYNGSNGSGTTSMYIGNALITAVSDIRLKDNIVDSTRNATEIINALRVVEHTWDDPSDQCENNRNSRGVWTGLIAQEAIAHIPWLVNKPTADVAEDGTPQYWHMDYGFAVPLLMKAIQEISADFQAYKSSHP
jgi:hypothetical protein